MEFEAGASKRLQAMDHIPDEGFVKSGRFGRGERGLQTGLHSSGNRGFGEQDNDGLQWKIVNYSVWSRR